MSDALPKDIRRIADLRKDRATPFALIPNAKGRVAIARELDVLALRKLRFDGTLNRIDEARMHLHGRLGATVVQPCVISLAPVTTRLEAGITRIYLAALPEPECTSMDVPWNDNEEPMPTHLNLADVMLEALVLHLPLYPRVPGAKLEAAVHAAYTAPGTAPCGMRIQGPLPH
ncbi:MAG: DUF177 domain-containing protein [Rhodobacteraceae bacterium]|nr:DUF177 domain-containing protein [Paracoccaceae bacterium]